MMALALRKKREEAIRKEGESKSDPESKLPFEKKDLTGQKTPTTTAKVTIDAKDEASSRGRRIDKGKARTRVEGFDDGKQDEE